MFTLDGKKVVIVGGSAGMGLATAEMAIDRGAEVVIAARNPARLAAAAEILAARGRRAVSRQALAIEDRATVAAFLRTHAPFDHLAPSLIDTPLLDTLHADDKEERCRGLAARLPVGRIGTAEEAAMAAIFLMTNGYVDGQVLGLDGGHLSIP